MADQPKWMPRDSVIKSAVLETWERLSVRGPVSTSFERMYDLLRAAVEKRDAEWALASGLETKHGDPDGLTPEKMEKFLLDFKAASTIALDQIAALCGCPTWEYPGQVVRDVEKALAKRGCARNQNTTQFCAEAVELQRKLDEQEARHRREVIEARIAEIRAVLRMPVKGESEAMTKRIGALRAELAALDKEAKGE